MCVRMHVCLRACMRVCVHVCVCVCWVSCCHVDYVTRDHIKAGHQWISTNSPAPPSPPAPPAPPAVSSGEFPQPWPQDGAKSADYHGNEPDGVIGGGDNELLVN